MVLTQYGPPESLTIQEIEKPIPKEDEVLIRVKASSVNISDYKLFVGQVEYGKTPLSDKLLDKLLTKAIGKPLGCDAAGIVEAVGDKVTEFRVGDEVFGATSIVIGAWAEYVCIPQTFLGHKPHNISFEQAAAVPVAGITALGAVRKAKVQAGQQVLIYGASGGVGQMALQLSKAAGAEITAVCSTRNLEIAKLNGADHVIDYTKEDFLKDNKQYNAIIAINGYRPLSCYKKALKNGGIYIVIGGAKQAALHAMLEPFYAIGSDKTLSFVMFSAIKDKGLDYMGTLLESGTLKPHIDTVYPISKAPIALRYIIKDHAQGKVVLNMVF